MFPSTFGPLESYNSLQDHHLMGYYSNPRKLRHLRNMGLITREGEIVDDTTFRLNAAKKEHAQNTKTLLAASMVKKAAELETQRCIELRRKLEHLSRMERVEKIKMARQHPPGLEEDFNPYPPGTQPPPQSGGSQRPAPLIYPPRPQSSMDILHQRLGITASEVDLYHTVAKPKIISGGHTHSPYSSTGPLIQPMPPSAPRPLSKTAPPSHGTRGRQGTTPKRRSTIRRRPVASSDTNKLQDQPEVTLYYTGPSLRLEGVPELTALTDVVILQQHCGGNTVCVFKARVKAQDQISFTSRRHRDCPFGISIYVDGMIDTRVSVCCEYRHKAGKSLGCKNGHFKLVKVSGGKPCMQCQLSEGERGVGRLSQQKKAPTTIEKHGDSERDRSSVALAILKDLQPPPVEGTTSSASKDPHPGSHGEQEVQQVGVADESAQGSAKVQENGRHGESGQEPTLTSAEQQYEEEFGDGDDSFENGNEGSEKDSDSEVDTVSSTHSDSDSGDKGGDSDGDKGGHSDSDKGSHNNSDKGGYSDGDKGSHSDGDSVLVAHPPEPIQPSGGEGEPVDRNDSYDREGEGGSSKELGRKESAVIAEVANDGEEAGGESEEEVEEEVDKGGKEETAESMDSGGGNDSGRENMGDGEDACDGADGNKNEMEDAVGTVRSKEELTVEGDGVIQLAAAKDDDDDEQIGELVSSPAHGGEGDSPVRASQEGEPDMGVVKGELEGGATSGVDPSNVEEQRDCEREEIGVTSNTSGAECRPVEEAPKTASDEQPVRGEGDGTTQQPVSIHLAHSSSVSSVSSLSSSEYSLASDNDN